MTQIKALSLTSGHHGVVFDVAHGRHFKVGKVNVDDYPEIAGVFNVFSIPTVVVFDGGEVVKTLTGARTAEKLASDLSEYMK